MIEILKTVKKPPNFFFLEPAKNLSNPSKGLRSPRKTFDFESLATRSVSYEEWAMRRLTTELRFRFSSRNFLQYVVNTIQTVLITVSPSHTRKSTLFQPLFYQIDMIQQSNYPRVSLNPNYEPTTM